MKENSSYFFLSTLIQIYNKQFLGEYMKQLLIVSSILFSLFAGCSVLTLQPANFSWPLESVLPVDENGNISDDRYSLEVNTVGMFFEEFQDSLSYKGKDIRLIRDNQGFYYMTSSNFKNVYVFNTDEGKLVLENIADGTNKMNLTYKGVEGGSK